MPLIFHLSYDEDLRAFRLFFYYFLEIKQKLALTKQPEKSYNPGTLLGHNILNLALPTKQG